MPRTAEAAGDRERIQPPICFSALWRGGGRYGRALAIRVLSDRREAQASPFADHDPRPILPLSLP